MRKLIEEMSATLTELSFHWDNYHHYGLHCEKKESMETAKKLARQLDDFFEQAKRVKIKKDYPRVKVCLTHFPHDEEQELPF